MSDGSNEQQFAESAAALKRLKVSPANTELLKLYGLYKQATAGDNRSSQPWAVQLEARAKWDAWTACKGKSPPEARDAYVALAQTILAKYA
ncbi:MAG: acyl-CoA-binding protein [Candidatus Sericytochromatia bacterium]|nr:acyl-CoA-binding protein [Candidatus Sericytochromatia bacterium]